MPVAYMRNYLKHHSLFDIPDKSAVQHRHFPPTLRRLFRSLE